MLGSSRSIVCAAAIWRGTEGMDGERFDRMARAFAAGSSRRRLLRASPGIVGALGLARHATVDVVAGPVLRGPGEICRKDGECVSGTTCKANASGRKVCACAAGTEACGKGCIPAGACCDHSDCHACGCMRCDPSTHTCVQGCDAAAGESCVNGVCVDVCHPGEKLCSHAGALCAGNGCTCAEQGKECLDCCCEGQFDCTCGTGETCGGTAYRCCCTETECDCGSAIPICCGQDATCDANCCNYPNGETACFPAPAFGVRR